MMNLLALSTTDTSMSVRIGLSTRANVRVSIALAPVPRVDVAWRLLCLAATASATVTTTESTEKTVVTPTETLTTELRGQDHEEDATTIQADAPSPPRTAMTADQPTVEVEVEVDDERQGEKEAADAVSPIHELETSWTPPVVMIPTMPTADEPSRSMTCLAIPLLEVVDATEEQAKEERPAQPDLATLKQPALDTEKEQRDTAALLSELLRFKDTRDFAFDPAASVASTCSTIMDSDSDSDEESAASSLMSSRNEQSSSSCSPRITESNASTEIAWSDAEAVAVGPHDDPSSDDDAEEGDGSGSCESYESLITDSHHDEQPTLVPAWPSPVADTPLPTRKTLFAQYSCACDDCSGTDSGGKLSSTAAALVDRVLAEAPAQERVQTLRVLVALCAYDETRRAQLSEDAAGVVDIHAMLCRHAIDAETTFAALVSGMTP